MVNVYKYAAHAAIEVTFGLTVLAGRHIALDNSSINEVTGQQSSRTESTTAQKGIITISDRIRTFHCAS
jgi:hypothetical protein